MKIFRVTRIIKEEADIEAESKEEAVRLVGENGANWDVTVLKESAKPRKV